MSRIGLRLGGKPAHESQIDHGRRVSWAVRELMEEQKRQQDTYTVTHAADPEEDREGRPPPCVGICYYKKLQALQAKEALLASHNYVVKQEEEDGDGCVSEHCGGEDRVDDLVIFEPIDLDGKLVGLGEEASGDEARKEAEQDLADMDSNTVEASQAEVESSQTESKMADTTQPSAAESSVVDAEQSLTESEPAEIEPNLAESGLGDMDLSLAETESNLIESDLPDLEPNLTESRQGEVVDNVADEEEREANDDEGEYTEDMANHIEPWP